MKRLLPVVLFSLLTSVNAMAQTAAQHDAHHDAQKNPSNPPLVKPARPATMPGENGMAMAQMQDHMKKMQELMARLQTTADSAERRKLMDDHMKAMQEGMGMMRGMGGGMMQGMDNRVAPAAPKSGAGQDRMGMGRGAKMSPEMMERRMDMMQMMMEQMMQHEQMREGASK